MLMTKLSQHWFQLGKLLRFTVAYCLVFLLVPAALYSQGNCNTWYFGANAGITFNTATPTPLTNSAMFTTEGCSTMSDMNGNLLFYTNGSVVFNKNHVLMPNGSGLAGHQSSSESSVVVPKPGTFNAFNGYYDRYYIFTSDYNQGTNGFRFSEVDMTLAGGLGDVVAGTKNTLLFSGPSTEKIAVATHANGCDYWVVGRPSYSTDFYSYQVSSAGVTTSPVVSTIPGSAFSPTLAAGIGSMKASPDNKYIAVINGYSPSGAAFYQNGLFVYNFDNATGLLSPKFYHASSGSPLFPYAFTNSRLGYGVEFSPNSKLIYTTGLYSASIQQYDLTVATNALFQSSRQNIGLTASTPDGNGYSAAALQLGPDNKIYVALSGSTSLGIISSPNTSGSGCNYQDMVLSLSGKSSLLGLPSFVNGLMGTVKKIVLKDSCITSNVRFELNDTSKVLSYAWTFAPATNTTNIIATASGYSTNVNFPGTGQYLATLGLSFHCYTYTISSLVDIGPPSFTVANAAICSGSSATLTANGLSSYTYSWSPGLSASSGSVVTANTATSQTYTVSALDTKGCRTTSTVNVAVNPNPMLTINSISNVTCFGQSTGSISTSFSGGAGSGYTLTPSNTNGLPAGTYTLQLTDANACITQTVVSISQPSAALTASVVSTTSVACNGVQSGSVSLSVSGGSPAYTYTWQANSSVGSTASGYGAGTYTCQVNDANQCGPITNTFTIAEPSAPLTLNSLHTDVLCHGQANGAYTATVSGGTPGYSYSWVGASSSGNTVTGLAAGNYTFMATDANNCVITQSFAITEPVALAAALTATTYAGCGLANGGATVSVTGGISPYIYNWNLPGGTTYTTAIGSTSSLPAGTSTLNITDMNGCSTMRSVIITNFGAPIINTGVLAVSCFGGADGIITTTVSGGTPAYTYSWSTGASSGTLTGLSAGVYSLVVVDANQCATSYSVQVSEPAALVTTLNYTNTSGCNQTGSVTATILAGGGTPGYTYLWQPGGYTTASVLNVPSGNYTVTVKDTKQCAKTETLSVEALYVPMTVVLQSESQPWCKTLEGSLSVGVSGGNPSYQYLWNTGAITPTLSGISEGSYSVVVTDSLNCQVSFSYQLGCHFEVFIPEYFSPNGDGKNDRFEIKAIDQYPHNVLTIYNRWGSEVYKKEGYANEWDGTSNSADATGSGLLPTGTYYVILDFGDGADLKPYHGIVQIQH